MVGKAIKESGMPREQLYITTKLGCVNLYRRHRGLNSTDYCPVRVVTVQRFSSR